MMLDKVTSFDPDFASPAEWAEMYRARGIQMVPGIYPMRDRNDKHPQLATWKQFQDELVGDELFRKWFPDDAKPNMGAICGAASGCLLVIDLDEYKPDVGPKATAWWRDLTGGVDPETWMQRTGGGGRQVFFRLPRGLLIHNATNTAIGVDIRCQSGFALMPPTLHFSGNRYQWIDGFEPWNIDIDVAPQEIIDAVMELSETHPSRPGEKTPTPDAVRDWTGADIDGRERKIRNMVWGRLADLRRDHPTKPSAAEFEEQYQDLLAAYLRTTKTRFPGDNLTGLEREGRGPTAFRNAWNRAVRKWDREIAEAATKPRPLDVEAKEPPPRPIDPATGQPLPLILNAAQFVAGFTPPEYLIDGILQRGYLYSLTAKTGHGKTAVTMFMAKSVAYGTPIRGCDVTQGSVLILAGENPDDVRARYLVLADKHGFDAASAPIHFIAGIIDVEAELPRIRAEAAAIPNLMLVIVDTAAAYFKGDDSNSNAQQGAYARLLRELTFLPNKPAGIINAHPVKNAGRDSLIPVGGGAFLNEVDGNLTLWSSAEKQTVLHWQGKFRGPEFEPITFKIETAHSERVKDKLGRLMPSVVALPASELEQEQAEEAQQSADRVVLAIIGGNPPLSIRNIARKANFVDDKRQPQVSKVQRILGRLKDSKLIADVLGKAEITEAGKRVLGWNKNDD